MGLLREKVADPARQELFDLKREFYQLQAERDALQAQLEGNLPHATAWLQVKVWSQRRALDDLNRRVVSQRLALRTIEQLGRGLTRDEYLAARDAVRDERLRDRIEETV